jgi:ATP-dependent helicase HrpA/adenine-specific DNA-methyltransferase
METNKPSNLQDKYLGKLHKGAKVSTQEYARELRSKTTEAEQKLWSLLRNRQLKGKKFRRQHAISNYIVDFYCNECKLVIELDGKFHTAGEAKEYDAARTALLNELGITVLRFWNEEVINDPAKVLGKISEYLL